MMPMCNFADISEHDMDMLIMEEFICDEGFRKIFLEKITICNCAVHAAYHSLMDENGESDITFVIEVEGKKHGILIEDKIDAVTMQKQSERYYIRGNKAVERGEFADFDVFLVCPEEYWKEHKEDPNAQYKHIVFYEELQEYLMKRQDIRSQYKQKIIEQALNAKKKGYQVIENDNVTKFWKDLQQFCEEKFPSLYMNYDGKPKGSSSRWIYFKTPIQKMWVVYKANSGKIMLESYDSKRPITKEAYEPFLENGMEFCKVGKSFDIMLHKERWKISVLDDFNDVIDVVTEVLEQIMCLVELVKKVELSE